eukprot:4868558-Prymnesium_polylepis.1
METIANHFQVCAADRQRPPHRPEPFDAATGRVPRRAPRRGVPRRGVPCRVPRAAAAARDRRALRLALHADRAVEQ